MRGCYQRFATTIKTNSVPRLLNSADLTSEAEMSESRIARNIQYLVLYAKCFDSIRRIMKKLRELHAQIDKEYDDKSLALEEEYAQRSVSLKEGRERDHIASIGGGPVMPDH